MAEPLATPTPPAASDGSLTSTVSRRWTIRMVITSVVLIGFGFWGLYDALVAYPKRGARAAEYFEYQYLDQYAQQRPPLDRRASVEDPASALARLEAIEFATVPPADRPLMAWLEQLQMIGRLDSANTTIPRAADFRGDAVQDAVERLAQLRQRFTTSSGKQADSPSALSWYDIPSQWLITAVGLGTGLYVAALVLRVRSRVFRWEPASRRLTLPGGVALVPADIAEFDKRKWHKFFVTLKVRPAHPQAGGQAIPLDLLRYEPVESWVLEMEREAFPESATPPPPDPATRAEAPTRA